MSIRRTPRPIAQVQGWCVGGGDMALCADLIIAWRTPRSERPTRASGAATRRACGSSSAGAHQALAEHALTGKPLSAAVAEVEPINAAVPFEALEATVASQAEQLASIPSSQLAAMKLVVNRAYENRTARDPDPRPDHRRSDAQHAWTAWRSSSGLRTTACGRHRAARRTIWRLQRGSRRAPARPGPRGSARADADDPPHLRQNGPLLRRVEHGEDPIHFGVQIDARACCCTALSWSLSRETSV